MCNGKSTLVSVRYIIDDTNAAATLYTKRFGFTLDLNAARDFRYSENASGSYSASWSSFLRRAAWRAGGSPKSWRYSRLNCEGLW